MHTSAYEFNGCYAKYDQHNLVIGNERIERRWDLSEGVPFAVSLVNKIDGVEWLHTDVRGGRRVCGLPLWHAGASVQSVQVQFGTDDDRGIAAPHLLAKVILSWGIHEMKLELLVYPGEAWIRQRIWVRMIELSEGDVHEALTNREGLYPSEQEDGAQPSAQSLQLDDNAKLTLSTETEDFLDTLPLREQHVRWQSVELRDVTDTNNNLISSEQGMLYTNEKRKVKGNVMLLEETLQPTGLLLIKEGPTPFGHLHYPGGDFEFTGRTIRVTGAGIGISDLRDGEWIPAYGSAVGVWQGGEYEGLQLLDRLHRSIRKYKPERDYFLMCNNWGDRSKDGRVSEAFALAELNLAAELGITNYQIDDGWQHGNTTNSVNPAGGRWSDYYADGDSFWNIHPDRFPNGFEPLMEVVERTGLRLALWFSPDSANDFANWHKDAARLLELHRQYGVCYFKLDGIKIKTKYGETNLVRMMQQVVSETGGRVYFNLDATNQVRLGYYGRTQYGGLFLENRYTDFRSYYPHWTLRNLWLLSKYVPTQKLQMEFLNVDRNRDRYPNDPLSPWQSGIAYAFAVTMFTNPLVWLEVTGLSEESKAVLKQMLQVYNKHQASILNGRVLPIGDIPDGTRWTGFQSVTDEHEGYLLIIRELHSQSSGECKLWGLVGEKDDSVLELTPLLKMEERNKIHVEDSDILKLTPERGNDTYTFELRNPFSFALYHYKLGKKA
jgi:hypothetical protein